jgi:hypothetical protein
MPRADFLDAHMLYMASADPMRAPDRKVCNLGLIPSSCLRRPARRDVAVGLVLRSQRLGRVFGLI